MARPIMRKATSNFVAPLAISKPVDSSHSLFNGDSKVYAVQALGQLLLLPAVVNPGNEKSWPAPNICKIFWCSSEKNTVFLQRILRNNEKLKINGFS